MLISNLLFIFSKWVSFIFLGQIWFRNLKFFKFIEIWYIGRLVYAYFDFIFYFFKFFVIHIRSGKFAPKNWSSSNSLKCRILMFIFSRWVSFIFLGQIWFRNLKFFKFIEIWYIGRLVYAYFDFIFYFFKFFVIHIRSGKFAPKNWSSSNSLKCRILMFSFSKF